MTTWSSIACSRSSMSSIRSKSSSVVRIGASLLWLDAGSDATPSPFRLSGGIATTAVRPELRLSLVSLSGKNLRLTPRLRRLQGQPQEVGVAQMISPYGVAAGLIEDFL